MTGGGEFRLRRLIVALDDSLSSRAALEAAVQLASRLGAEIAGLFVEDEDVLRWSRMPKGRAVDAATAALKTVDAPAVERGLVDQAERARRSLEAAAERERVRWSFRVARGRVGRALTEAAAEVDLLALGRSSFSHADAARLGSTARFVVAESSSKVLLLRPGESVIGPVVVLHAAGAEGERAFLAAVSLARRDGGRLVLLVPGSPEEARDWGRRRAGLAGPLEVVARPIRAAEPAALAAAAGAEAAGLLVLPAGACAGKLSAACEAAPCPVLSVA